MSAEQPNATHRSSATEAMPTTTEEGYLRRYNSKPQDTAVGRAEMARMLADSDTAAWDAA